MSETLEQPPMSEDMQAVARQAQAIDDAAAATAGKTLFAVVESNGTLARGVGAVSVSTLGPGFPGAYQVVFNRNVSRGAFVATIGVSTPGLGQQPGEITVALRLGTTNTVFVRTSDSTGAFSDRSFHLVVVLP